MLTRRQVQYTLIVEMANLLALDFTQRRGVDEFNTPTFDVHLRRLRCSTYSDTPSAVKTTIARLLNSATGMLDCCMYTSPAVPTSPAVTATLSVCEAMPGLAIVSEYEPGVRYISYCP